MSLAAKLLAAVALALLLGAAAGAGTAALGAPPFVVFAVSLAVGLPAAALSIGRLWAPVHETLAAVSDGIRSFHDRDFGLRLAVSSEDEVGELAGLYNRLGDALREQRNEVFQRELLLDTVLQGAPMAIVLLNPLDRVAYANRAARRILEIRGSVNGRALQEVAEAAPEAMLRALAERRDGLFTAPGEGGDEVYRVMWRDFLLNTQTHRLLVVERMTPELRRQEVETWKNVIRVLSHELNNSLAPVSSLVHSARRAASRPEHAHRLEEILLAIDERVKHLTGFLSGYARLARLPRPEKKDVDWAAFLSDLGQLYPFRLDGALPRQPGFFDAAQLEQALINILKNAAEAGGPREEVTLSLEEVPGATLIHVRDRGAGMDEDTMRQALSPFYSRKEGGTGLGLPLSAEILAAHGGRLSLKARDGGGTEVTCVVPSPGEIAGLA